MEMSEPAQQNREEAKEWEKRRSLRQLRSQFSTASTGFDPVFVMQRTMFEVRVPGLKSKEEVRISGNVPSLGEWDLQRSIVLSRRDG